MQNDPKPIACTDGCKTTSLNPMGEGWTHLHISRRWRCPACARALQLVNQREAELLQKSYDAKGHSDSYPGY